MHQRQGKRQNRSKPQPPPGLWFNKVSSTPLGQPEIQRTPAQDAARFSWVKPGAQVEHQKFGRGQVMRMERDIAVIKFAGGTKNMEFPGAFARGILEKPGEER